MDGFSYVNIFETKGIEYIVIIAFLLLLIPFWILLNKRVEVAGKIRQAFRNLSFNILKIPQGVFFTPNHTWAYLEKSGTAKIGLDDMLLHMTGDVRINPVKTNDEMVSRGDVIAEIWHNDRHLKVHSPISGKVIQTNPMLNEEPGRLNADPYGDGWVARIEPTDWKGEMQGCYLAGEATEWFKNEMERARDFLAVNAQKYSSEPSLVTLQDGGELTDHVLADLPEGLWQDFEREFLDPNQRE